MDFIKNFWIHQIPFRDINLWLGGAIYGIVVYLILVIMQPFGIDQNTGNIYILMIPYFFVTWIGCVLPSYILPLFCKDFFYAKKWTRGRFFIYLLSIVSIISFGNLICFIITLIVSILNGYLNTAFVKNTIKNSIKNI